MGTDQSTTISVKELKMTMGMKNSTFIVNDVSTHQSYITSGNEDNGKKTSSTPLSTNILTGRSSLVENKLVSSIILPSAVVPSSTNPQLHSNSSFQTSTHASEMTSSVTSGIFNTYSFSLFKSPLLTIFFTLSVKLII